MSDTEIKECLQALLGEDAQQKLREMKDMNAKSFAEHVLGFEPLRDSPP